MRSSYFLILFFFIISCSEFKNSEIKTIRSENNKEDLINFFLNKGEVDSAHIHIEKIYNKDPDNLENLVKRGDVNFLLNDYEVSKNSWLKCLEIDNNNESCYNKLIGLYCGVLELDGIECRDFISKALKVNKRNKTALFFKAKNYIFQEKYSSAIETFEKVVQLDSNNIRALNELAILYDTNKKSEFYYNKMIKIDSSFISFYGLGMYYQKKNMYKEAIKSYLNAIKNETKREAYYNIGYCYLLMNNLIKAKDYFSNAINTDPSYLEAYYARAYTYKKLDEIILAIEDFKFCLMLEPGNEDARLQLENLK